MAILNDCFFKITIKSVVREPAFIIFKFPYFPNMITKESVVQFFSKSKVIFASIAAFITFSITLYNQFKSDKTTEISGVVSSAKDPVVPVDAIVKIISPIQGETQTDSRGRFRFKFHNLVSDTILLVVQNKKTNTETKQNEYVDADGRRDIFVLFNQSQDTSKVYAPLNKVLTAEYAHRKPNLNQFFQKLGIPHRHH